MNVPVISPLRAGSLVGRGVFIELSRRQDFYVLLTLMMVFLVGVLAANVVGIEDASTGTFLLNLGMTLAYYAAHLLTLLLMARQLPDEFENRTLYPLLAKPIDRDVLLIGKWLACALCGTAVFGALLLFGWLPVPRVATYDVATFAQTLALIPISLALLASWTLALSLVVPKGVVLVVGIVLFIAGDHPGSLLARGAESTPVLAPVVWLARYIPDFSTLNLITRYTDGMGPLPAMQFAGAVTYGVVLSATGLLAAMALFRRCPI